MMVSRWDPQEDQEDWRCRRHPMQGIGGPAGSVGGQVGYAGATVGIRHAGDIHGGDWGEGSICRRDQEYGVLVVSREAFVGAWGGRWDL